MDLLLYLLKGLCLIVLPMFLVLWLFVTFPTFGFVCFVAYIIYGVCNLCGGSGGHAVGTPWH